MATTGSGVRFVQRALAIFMLTSGVLSVRKLDVCFSYNRSSVLIPGSIRPGRLGPDGTVPAEISVWR